MYICIVQGNMSKCHRLLISWEFKLWVFYFLNDVSFKKIYIFPEVYRQMVNKWITFQCNLIKSTYLAHKVVRLQNVYLEWTDDSRENIFSLNIAGLYNKKSNAHYNEMGLELSWFSRSSIYITCELNTFESIKLNRFLKHVWMIPIHGMTTSFSDCSSKKQSHILKLD